MGRNKVIDIMKGIGIFLVVFAHTLKNSILITTIYIFHMPLFFILSGYLIKFERPKTFIQYFKKKINSIIFPYFIFSTLSFLYWFLLERRFRNELVTDTILPKNVFLNIFYMKMDSSLLLPNIVLWFLPCLFFANLLFYYIKKINQKKMRVLLTLILFIVGYILCVNNIIFPFAIEIVLIVLLFLEIGFELSEFNIKKNIVAILSISIVFYIISLIFNRNINILEHSFGNPILFITGAVGGTGLVYIVSSVIEKNNYISKIFQYIGINSLTIMLVHEPLKRIVIYGISKIFDIEDSILRSNFVECIFISILIITIIIPIIIFINKYTPWLIGKKRNCKLSEE